MDLVAEIDRLLAQVRSALAYAEYEDGREEALMEARTLAKAYVQAQVDLVARLVKEDTARREQAEEAAQVLARAQGLVHPGHRSLRELVEGLTERAAQDRRELEEHDCEAECDNCRWGGDDEGPMSDDVREEIKGVIQTLEGLVDR